MYVLCAGGACDGSVEANVPGPLCLRQFYSLAGNRTPSGDEGPQGRIDVHSGLALGTHCAGCSHRCKADRPECFQEILLMAKVSGETS